MRATAEAVAVLHVRPLANGIWSHVAVNWPLLLTSFVRPTEVAPVKSFVITTKDSGSMRTKSHVVFTDGTPVAQLVAG